ncbi:MAG: DUF4349 domain-containing protein [Nannocystaceae bacterium]
MLRIFTHYQDSLDGRRSSAHPLITKLLGGAAVAVLATGFSGCSADMSRKSSMAPSSEMVGGPAGYGGGEVTEAAYMDDMAVEMDEEYGGDEDMAPPAPIMAKTEAAFGSKDRRTSETSAEPETPEQSNDEPQQFARQIIYVADMTISVFNLEDAMEKAEKVATQAGGYVQAMSTGQYVLRIPAAKLRNVMENLGGLGVVENRNLQARDVTEEFFDLQTRIEVLEGTQTQLLNLLKKAKNVKEALSVRQALDKVTMELEQAKGRLRLLQNQIGFSTLTVRIEERGPHTSYPTSDDPFPWVDSLGVEATEWK